MINYKYIRLGWNKKSQVKRNSNTFPEIAMCLFLLITIVKIILIFHAKIVKHMNQNINMDVRFIPGFPSPQPRLQINLLELTQMCCVPQQDKQKNL